MDNYTFRSLEETRKELQAGSISARSLCTHFIGKAQNDTLNAFLEVFSESALKQADAVDEPTVVAADARVRSADPPALLVAAAVVERPVAVVLHALVDEREELLVTEVGDALRRRRIAV